MSDSFLHKAYGLAPDQTSAGFYDAWADSYDREIAENGYATPRRCAEALAAAGAPADSAVLDFGCGTGLSGLALRAAGFATVDGWDVSDGMLEKAAEKGCYRALTRIEPDGPLPETAPYDAVVAAGVIGAGAAPATAFDAAMGVLRADGFITLSLNDHALADPQFEARIMDWIDCGAAELIAKDYGDHLPGIRLKAMVYVLRKR
jgi:predicted TPR repeat methyltransferase